MPLDIDEIKFIPRVEYTMREFMRYAVRLLQFDWSFLDERYTTTTQLGNGIFPCVIDRYGRIAIEFLTKGYTPGICVGFLYDSSDHKVELTMPEKGIDLMLRIEACPVANNNVNIIIDQLQNARDRILSKERQEGRQILTKIRLKGEHGNENKWNLLITQICLANVIADYSSEEEQLNSIYSYFKELIIVLFSDRKLEESLKRLNPYKGKMTTGDGARANWPHPVPRIQNKY